MAIGTEIGCAGTKAKLTSFEVEDPNTPDSWGIIEQMIGAPTISRGETPTTEFSCIYSNENTVETGSKPAMDLTFEFYWVRNTDAPNQKILRDAYDDGSTINVRIGYNNSAATEREIPVKVISSSEPIVDGELLKQTVSMKSAGTETWTNY